MSITREERMINTIEINWELLGAKFANMNDTEQSLFFKGLAQELMNWESIHKVQMQFSFISDKLNDKQKNILDDALGMLYYKDEV